jgi:peptidoglycan/xylan/chitin deacetylase (PgdA/CDA1 family)/ubiquinone/menaquinone biosynthesis C-methylase UbiE
MTPRTPSEAPNPVMRRWMLIVVPTLLLAAVVAHLRSGATAWLAASLVVLGGGVAVAWFIFDPNSSVWAPTVWRAKGPVNAVALTFDDGPDRAVTLKVLDILEAKQVPGTFFVVGERVRDNVDIVQAIDGAGHLVGNHSDRHGLMFHFQLWQRLRSEIDTCNTRIRDAIGKEPLLFRSPQGFKSPCLGDVLRERGMTAIGWQVRGLDAGWRDEQAIVKRIVGGAKAGGVVTLHDGSGLGGTADRTPTLQALPLLIDGLRARGLQLVRLDQLLGLPAYRQASVDRRRVNDGAPAPVLVKDKVEFVAETKVGTWFIRTPTWANRVMRIALSDLERLIPARKERYPDILDVGCGHGASFPQLQERFNPDRIVGVDAHMESLEQAAKSAARCTAAVELLCSDAAETGLPDESFDMIFCHQSFHHLSQHEKAAREFYRLLKPGGVLLFAESTRAYIHSWLIRILFNHPMDVQKTADEYLSVLRCAGFVVPSASVSLPYLWWSRPDLGAREWCGLPVASQREETLINAVAVRPSSSPA